MAQSHGRVLLTGAAGFIGSHLAQQLLADGIHVRGIDCFNDNYGRAEKLSNLRHLTDWDSFEFIPIDLARGELPSVIEGCDCVYHLAAEPGVRASWGTRYEQYVRNNVLSTQHILEALRSEPATRLVYASSSSVYGDADVRPTPESSQLRPRSPYGQTKASMEFLCELYHYNFGSDVVGLRYFTVYGPRQRPDMAFNRICKAGITGGTFTVFGDGSQTRDFTFVQDIVDATCVAAVADLQGHRVVNVGGGSPASLRDAIAIVDDLSGGNLDVRYQASEQGDVRDTAADTSVAHRVLNFTPSVSLRDGLEKEFEWLSQELTGHRG